MAKKQPVYDGFFRSKRRDNGVHGSYSGAVSKAAARKGYDSLRKTLMLVLLCAILPPVGIVLVFAEPEKGPAFRAVCTALAAVVMFFFFKAIIPPKQPAAISVSKVAPVAIEQPAAPSAGEIGGEVTDDILAD